MAHISINIHKDHMLKTNNIFNSWVWTCFYSKENAPSLFARTPSPSFEQFSAVHSSPKEQGESNRFKVTRIIIIYLDIT